MKLRTGLGVFSLVAALLLGLTQGTTFAQVKPGDLITPQNATKVKDIVSPGTYYKLMKGMTMKIIPSGRIDWPPPYKDATEKYSGQVRLSDGGGTIASMRPLRPLTFETLGCGQVAAPELVLFLTLTADLGVGPMSITEPCFGKGLSRRIH
jgi:hypothetical protein